MSAKEEELKGNEIDLVAKFKELEKAQAEIGELRGELTKFREEVRSLRPQLKQAKAATVNVFSEYQSLDKMVALKKILHDEGYEEAVEAFAYTVATTRLDWDLTFLGEHLIDQTTVWSA